MTIFCVWYTITMYATRFATFVSVKLCISSGSVRVCGLYRIIWILRIFMRLTRRFWRIRRDREKITGGTRWGLRFCCAEKRRRPRGASLCYVRRINLRGFLFDTQKYYKSCANLKKL